MRSLQNLCRQTLAPLALLAVTSGAYASDLINNGSFELGTSGFSSDYTPTSTNTLNGQYALVTNPAPYNNGFASYGDHTGMGGLMLLVDGASPTMRVWYEDLALEASTTYTFSFWASSVVRANPAIMRATLGGAALGSDFTLSGIPGQWQNVTTTFDSGAGGTSRIAIYDVFSDFAAPGDDFALDDISLTGATVASVPEPSAYALMACGMGWIAALARRRKLRR